MHSKELRLKAIDFSNDFSRMTTRISSHESDYEMYKDWVEQSQIAFEKTNDESHLRDIEKYIKKRDDAKQALEAAINDWNQLLKDSVINTAEIKG